MNEITIEKVLIAMSSFLLLFFVIVLTAYLSSCCNSTHYHFYADKENFEKIRQKHETESTYFSNFSPEKPEIFILEE